MKKKEETNVLIYKVEKEDEGKLLKDILYERMNLSGRLLRKTKKNKNIFVNENNISLGSKPRKGDLVKIVMEEEENQFAPQDIPIDVIYEDLDILIINKQPGVVVHPTKGHFSNTIANGISNYLLKSNQSFKIRFINRLDMDTSGLLMIAKNPFAQQALSKQMEVNLVEKKYLAVVKGLIEENNGTIDLPVGLTDEDHIRRQVTSEGQDSITHFEVVKRYSKASLVRLTIETGRTHQIRVHMKHIGYPIIGDELYGYVNKELINRQALHAEFLQFNQPRTGEQKRVNAHIPEDMSRLIDILEKESILI